MALSNESLSGKAAAKEESKAEEKPAKAGPLAPAGHSGDPAVQYAVAELQTARMNRATLDVEEADIKAADEAVKAKEKALADLGYE